MTQEELDKLEKQSKRADDFVFMREEIKSRPINRKKLARNTILVAISAVVFGVVACVTFALVAPFIMDKLSGESSEKEEPKVVIALPEETIEDEMNPEDMLVAADLERQEIDYSQFTILEEDEINKILSSIKFTVSDYQSLYRSLADIANNAKKSLVRVTPVKTGMDWLNNMYEYESELAGLILADSGQEYYICTRYSAVKGNKDIVVTFDNGISARAELMSFDSDTDIGMLSVSYEDMNEVTRESIAVASLGSSAYSSVMGSPVIVVGSPMGIYDSVNYGMVTSISGVINVTDNYYKRIVTNIYGSKNASGIIINLRGDVIGIIDIAHSTADSENLILGIGISELRKTLERLMNNQDVVLLGMTGADVPTDALAMGTPDGVYVLSVELNSPAMAAGIQSGDIVAKIGDTAITRFNDLVLALKNIEIDTTEKIVVYRSVQDTYKEVELTVSFNEYNR